MAILLPTCLPAGTLWEDFEDGDLAGWTTWGTWTVVDGVAVTESRGACSSEGSFLVVGDSNWRDYTVEARTRVTELLGAGEMAVIVRADLTESDPKGEAFGFRHDICWGGHRTIETWVNWFKVKPPSCTMGEWHRIKVRVMGNSFDFFIDDLALAHFDTANVRPGGSVGVAFSGAHAEVDEIMISSPDIPCELFEDLNARHICAGFRVTPPRACAGEEIEFDGTGSQASHGVTLASHSWDFGDGTTEDGAEVRHVFEIPGVYSVSLTIMTEDGSQDTTQRAYIVACPSGEVSPWISQDIGDPAFPGAARLEDGDLLVCGGGKGIYLTREDHFHFLRQEMRGDFVLTVRIKELRREDTSSMAGLMIRESLESDAPHASMVLHQKRTGQVSSKFLWRSEAGTASCYTPGAVHDSPDVFLRIERQSNAFLGSFSTDGSTWVEADRETIDMPDSVFAGITVTTVVPQTDHEYTIARLAFIPDAVKPALRRGDANCDGNLDIADAIRVLGYAFANETLSCVDAADINDDGRIDIADPIVLLDYIFGAQAPLPAPFPRCGPDPTPDDLRCESYPPCVTLDPPMP
ncbi:MAG: PKD domain-containing protein [Planctomycetes bacterium]|nr:PKD domain-containing protein [Planctomycetota bacterium]